MLRQQLKKFFLGFNRIESFLCKNDWYRKTKNEEVLVNLFEETKFLDSVSSLKERIFCIRNDIFELPKCTICRKNARFSNSRYTQLCGDILCKKKLVSLQKSGFKHSEETKNKMSQSQNRYYQTHERKSNYEIWIEKYGEEKANYLKENAIQKIRENHLKYPEKWETVYSDKNRIQKISKANSGSLEERFGREKAEKMKKRLLSMSINRKQTTKEKEKRILSRKNNNENWHSEETKKKISLTNKKTHSSKEFQERMKPVRAEIGKKLSKIMKQKIKDGLFTPCITNSWTHWSSYVNLSDGKRKFRSNWECLFFLYNLQKNIILEYETIRIQYQDKETSKIYLVDFCNKQTRKLFEIKPKSVIDSSVLLKFNAANEWCKQNNFQFHIISDEWFNSEHLNDIDYSDNPHLIEIKNQFLK